MEVKKKRKKDVQSEELSYSLSGALSYIKTLKYTNVHQRHQLLQLSDESNLKPTFAILQ